MDTRVDAAAAYAYILIFIFILRFLLLFNTFSLMMISIGPGPVSKLDFVMRLQRLPLCVDCSLLLFPSSPLPLCRCSLFLLFVLLFMFSFYFSCKKMIASRVLGKGEQHTMPHTPYFLSLTPYPFHYLSIAFSTPHSHSRF